MLAGDLSPHVKQMLARIAPDPSYSDQETRFYALGHNKGGRLLQIVFTIRRTTIRPISARNMSRKERKVYGQAAKEGADL
jgi:uncharacterized DUF497 family protein